MDSNTGRPVMVKVKCPKCQSELEIDDTKEKDEGKTAVFCSNKECSFNDNPLVGMDRREPGLYISESLL